MSKIADIRPDLIKRERGGWLAVSEAASSLRIGVVGSTQAEATDRFTEAIDEWSRLLDDTGSHPST